MGIHDLKSESIDLTTRLTVREIGVILQEICEDWKTVPEQVQSNSGALAVFDDMPDIAIVIHGKAGFLSPQYYIVHVYVYDLDDKRGVEIVALGSSALSKFVAGIKDAVKMSESIKCRDQIAEIIMSRSGQ